MEQRISVEIFRPKYVNHLQRWSRIFRSEETETNFSIWIPTEITGIFGIMKAPFVSEGRLTFYDWLNKMTCESRGVENLWFDDKHSGQCVPL